MSKKLIALVCFAVLALSAFSMTSGASAQWVVNGTTLAETAKLLVKFKVHLAATLESAGVRMECTAENFEGTAPQIEAGDKGSASSISFLGCKANAGCTIPTTLSTVPVTATAVLGAASAVNLTFKPKTKTIFATVKFEGAECALLGTQPVSGQFKALMPTGQTEKEVQLVEGNTSAASNELKVGSSAALLHCSILLILALHLTWRFV
jgi:hypothetical protein